MTEQEMIDLLEDSKYPFKEVDSSGEIGERVCFFKEQISYFDYDIIHNNVIIVDINDCLYFHDEMYFDNINDKTKELIRFLVNNGAKIVTKFVEKLNIIINKEHIIQL